MTPDRKLLAIWFASVGCAMTIIGLVACRDPERVAAPDPRTRTPEQRLEAFADSITFLSRDLWRNGSRSLIVTITLDTIRPPVYLYVKRP